MKNVAILLFLGVAAIAAPVTVSLGVSAYVDYRDAAVTHAALKRQERELKDYGEEVAEYRRFAVRVERFIDSARKAGVADERWNRHHVEIKDRAVSFAELDQFIADAGGGDNYYFLPSKLQIQARGGDATNSFRRSRVAISRDQVRVSLVGDFMVPVR